MDLPFTRRRQYVYTEIPTSNAPDVSRITSIIVTHQNRLKCLLNSFMDVKYRFGNCSVLEMKLIRERNNIKYQIDLIFKGFVKPNKKYYTTSKSSDRNNKNLFPFQRIQGVSNTFLDITASSLLPNTEYVFMLIRHGQATHNKYNIFTRFQSLYKMDTLLTNEGENQARKVGVFLKEYLRKEGLNVDCKKTARGRCRNINYIFTSDLKRTRQTMAIIVHQINPKNITEMIVLPCAHELDYFDDKNCDKRMINYPRARLAGENMMRCDIGKCDSEQKLYCCNVIYGDTKLSVNWSYYIGFYNGTGNGTSNGTRQDIYFEETKMSCYDTNMIKNAIDIMLLDMIQ